MNIVEYKQKLADKIDVGILPIFVYVDTDFVAMQYVRALAEIRNKKVVVVYDVEEIPPKNPFIEDNSLYVYKCDKFAENIVNRDDIAVVTKDVSKEIKSEYKDNVIEIPKLEPWMLVEYFKIYCSGLSDNTIKWFIDTYSNPYLIQLEIDKVSIFPEKIREELFKEFLEDGVFVASAENNIFTLIDGLQTKNTEKIISELTSDTEYEQMAFATAFSTSLRNMCKVWLCKNPTTLNTGLKSNQIWAINKLKHTYTKDELINAFEVSSSINRRVRSGLLPVDIVMDYVIIKALGGGR